LPASTPVLFVIDGDPGAAHALRDDLSRRFGREFRIVCESAADAGLAALRELAVRRVPVALLVVGQDLFSIVGLNDRTGHELRELLTRFNVPFRFVAADSGKGRRLLAHHGMDESLLPVLVRYDGR
jgi:hypothetical protein